MPADRMTETRTDHKRRKDEAFEYRLLMVLAYTIFLVAAVVRRVLQPIRRSAPAGQRRQSVFGEARMQADTCVPFAFMG